MVQYAFLLTLNGEPIAAQETLDHVINASPFVQSESRSLSLKLARCGAYFIFVLFQQLILLLLACYVRVADYLGMIAVARSIWQRYQFQTDPLRLLHALVPGGLAAVEASHLNTLQKYSIRQINMLAAIVDKEEMKKTPKKKAKARTPTRSPIKRSVKKVVNPDDDDGEVEPVEDDGEDEEPQEEQRPDSFKPTQINPVYIISHACMLLTSNSYSAAICTYSRWNFGSNY